MKRGYPTAITIIVMEYNQFYAHKFNNLKQMDPSLKNYKIWKLNQSEKDSWNNDVPAMGIWFGI